MTRTLSCKISWDTTHNLDVNRSVLFSNSNPSPSTMLVVSMTINMSQQCQCNIDAGGGGFEAGENVVYIK